MNLQNCHLLEVSISRASGTFIFFTTQLAISSFKTCSKSFTYNWFFKNVNPQGSFIEGFDVGSNAEHSAKSFLQVRNQTH